MSGGPSNDMGRRVAQAASITLAQLDEDFGKKAVAMLVRFYDDYVSPLAAETRDLENRLTALEALVTAPWWVRFYYRMIGKRWVQAILRLFYGGKRDSGPGVGRAEGDAVADGADGAAADDGQGLGAQTTEPDSQPANSTT